MYNTKDMQPQKDKKFEPIHMEAQQIMPKYNAYACGYGTHEKTKKQRHKANRKKNKMECKDLEL